MQKNLKLVRKSKNSKSYVPTKQMRKIAVVGSEVYKKGKNPIKFWQELAKGGISWSKPFKKTYEEKFPYFKWFSDGKLNVCYNAVDRHVEQGRGNRVAIIFIPEPVKEKKQIITYSQLYGMVNNAAFLLKKNKIKKGDVVGIYMPLIPETIVFMLACARIGAIHSVVFSAFSSEALRMRLKDGNAKLLITVDKYYRKGKTENLKQRAFKAAKGMKIKKIVVKRKDVGKFFLNKSKKKNKKAKEIKPVEMNSEDILFVLYTSGTTGKPKGVMHSTGGYAVQAYWSTKFNFNLCQADIMWCTADVGWVTGHTYLCYGPLLNGATTLIYEGALNYPTRDRFLKIIEKNNINVFYTAPTALRIFALSGEKYAKKYKLAPLRILGTVGEPIDEETWHWYFKNIGKNRCSLIDTWWQTETGSSLINSLPGVGPFIPVFAGKSFPGIKHAIVNEKGNKLKAGKKGFLVQLSPFAPGMLRGVWKNKKRYKKYFKYGLYFTGDNAIQDKDGNFRILGRADDIIKVAGHRLSTAEVENAIDSYPGISECAVVSKPDKIKGEAIVVFAKPEKGKKIKEEKIISWISEKIGPIAKPAEVYFVSDLPKTRSGKIMRRILKNLLVGEKLKDLSTLVNPGVVEEIEGVIEKNRNKN